MYLKITPLSRFNKAHTEKTYLVHFFCLFAHFCKISISNTNTAIKISTILRSPYLVHMLVTTLALASGQQIKTTCI